MNRFILFIWKHKVYFFLVQIRGANIIKCQARKFAEDLSEYTAQIAQRALARNLQSCNPEELTVWAAQD